MTTPKIEQQLAELVFQVARLSEEVRELRSQFAAAQKGRPDLGQTWLPTNEAAEMLHHHGIRSGKELRELVGLGVLPVDGKYVRNIGNGNGRPTYQFNPAACAQLIEVWKGLHPEDRRRIREQKNE